MNLYKTDVGSFFIPTPFLEAWREELHNIRHISKLYLHLKDDTIYVDPRHLVTLTIAIL
jgi:hypothetical protein